MPRRSRSMAPIRSSRSAVSVVEALFVLGRFFLGAQIDAAQLLALLLELFDALLGLFERRKFLAVLDFGAFGQFVRRDFQFVADAVAQFGDARLGAFEQSLFAGALLARRRQRVVGGLGDLVRFGQTGFRFGARVAGLRCARFRRCRWRRASAPRFSAMACGRASAATSSSPSSPLTAVQFGDMLGGGAAAAFPACAFVADRRQAPGCVLRRRASARRVPRAHSSRRRGLRWPVRAHWRRFGRARRRRRVRRAPARPAVRLRARCRATASGGGFRLPARPAARRARPPRARPWWKPPGRR